MKYEHWDDVLADIIPKPCRIRIETGQEFIRLWVGHRDWQWRVSTGEFVGSGIMVPPDEKRPFNPDDDLPKDIRTDFVRANVEIASENQDLRALNKRLVEMLKQCHEVLVTESADCPYRGFWIKFHGPDCELAKLLEECK